MDVNNDTFEPLLILKKQFFGFPFYTSLYKILMTFIMTISSLIFLIDFILQENPQNITSHFRSPLIQASNCLKRNKRKKSKNS